MFLVLPSPRWPSIICCTEYLSVNPQWNLSWILYSQLSFLYFSCIWSGKWELWQWIAFCAFSCTLYSFFTDLSYHHHQCVCRDTRRHVFLFPTFYDHQTEEFSKLRYLAHAIRHSTLQHEQDHCVAQWPCPLLDFFKFGFCLFSWLAHTVMWPNILLNLEN